MRPDAPDPGAVAMVAAILHDPRGAEYLRTLSTREQIVFAFAFEHWMRASQVIGRWDWTYWGFICGRGWGKSMAIAVEINRRVREGEARHIGLMAPTDDRVDEVQIAFLIATAPPWFRPRRHKGGLQWPNGVEAITFTPEAPGRPRSENLDLSWLCELVDWKATTRKEAFDNITTATRISRAQVIWDTTSRGKNEVIRELLASNAADPRAYPIQRGAMFDNPMLTRKYILAECRKYSGRRYFEEVEGKVYSESAAALWRQEWIDTHRVIARPRDMDLVVVSVDPAQSARHDADETGIVLVGRERVRRDAYILQDDTARLSPDQWGEIAVRHCVEGAAGIVLERNKLGDNARFVIKSCAREYAARTGERLEVRVLEDTRANPKPFPPRTPGVIYVREYTSRTSKEDRASGAATETKNGRVHVVGHLDDLEFELTSWEPGSTTSPNRLDAAAAGVNEVLELALPQTSASAREQVNDAAELNRKLAHTIAKGSRRVGI